MPAARPEFDAKVRTLASSATARSGSAGPRLLAEVGRSSERRPADTGRAAGQPVPLQPRTFEELTSDTNAKEDR